MILTIYGYPYHSTEYYFYDNASLLQLFKTYNVLDNVDNIKKALNYIDGVFAVQIRYDDNEIWISDYYGLFPLFYNPTEQKVIINFMQDMNVEKNKNYIDMCDKNIDNKYHSNIPIKNKDAIVEMSIPNMISIKNKIQKYLITPFKDWYILSPATIIYLKTKEKYMYTIDKGFYPEDIETIFINTIAKLSKNKSILIPLSAGYDSRCIFSVATKYVSSFYRYTYGVEKEFVDSHFKYDNVITDYTYNEQEIINQNILRMNGMSDIYYKTHNFHIQQYFKNFDILFTGDGANEHLKQYKNLFKYFYATGDGHHYKTQAEKIITVPPYSQKRIISNKKYYTTQLDRQEFSKNIINLTNKDLLQIPFYSGNVLTKNKASNYGHTFSFNTKLEYIHTYYKKYYREVDNYET